MTTAARAEGSAERRTPARLPASFILRFWFPLAATWLMMSAEGPYVAAIIARLADPAYNLAAYGVAFAVAWLVESPIMMLMTAANNLVRGHASFVAMRRFMYTINTVVTAVMIIAVTPPVFAFAAHDVMRLPPDIATLAHRATVLLILWPAAIGYRRFYQGVLVRHGSTRRVAYGTVVRLTTMSGTAALLAFTTSRHGATIGTASLASGVLAEAVASRWMARHAIASFLATPDPASMTPLTQRSIAHFYYPLALTSMIYMITAPLLTLFMGRGRAPIESLAVLPVVQSLLFVFRGGGIAYQEVGVALTGHHAEHAREITRVGTLLALGTSAVLALVVFTPFSHIWFERVSSLSPALAGFAIVPAQLLVLLPATEYWLSMQRTGFILAGDTRDITIATIIEVGGLAAVVMLCVNRLGMIGVVAGSVALMAGRLMSNAYLVLRSGAASHPSSA